MRIAADVRLRVDLLRQLSQLERTFRSGCVIVVEPSVDGLRMTNSVGLLGHDHSVVEAHLRAMLVERLIENGGMFHPNVGTYFARLVAVACGHGGTATSARLRQARRYPPAPEALSHAEQAFEVWVSFGV